MAAAHAVRARERRLRQETNMQLTCRSQRVPVGRNAKVHDVNRVDGFRGAASRAAR
jgi:hypothetical protein